MNDDLEERLGRLSPADPPRELLRRLRAAEHEVTTHPGSQVDDRVDVGGADDLDRAAVQRDVA